MTHEMTPSEVATPASKLISIGSYLFGMFTGQTLGLAMVIASAMLNDPDYGFLIFLLPFFWLAPSAIGAFTVSYFTYCNTK
jgi:hypothetical protein